MKHIRVTPDEALEAACLYRQGYSLRVIGSRLGYSRSVIGRCVRAAGIKTQTSHVTTPAEQLEIARMGRQGCSIAEIQKHIGCGCGIVYKYFKKFGVETPQMRSMTNKSKEAARLFQQGCSLTQIQSRLGPGQHFGVRRYLKMAGIEPPKRRQRRFTDDVKQESICLYKKGWPLREIAKKFGRGRGILRKHLREAGVYDEPNLRVLNKPLDPEIKAAVPVLYNNGHTIKEIAEHFNLPYSRIGAAKGSRGFNRRHIKPGSALAKEIVQLHDEEHLDFQGIADRFGLARGVVSRGYRCETGKTPGLSSKAISAKADKLAHVIVELHDNKMLSFPKIRQHLGLGGVRSAYLRATGRKFAKRIHVAGDALRHAIPEKHWQEIATQFRNGWSARRIAGAWGVATSPVRGIVRQFKLFRGINCRPCRKAAP